MILMAAAQDCLATSLSRKTLSSARRQDTNTNTQPTEGGDIYDKLRKQATCEAAMEGNLPVDHELSSFEWHEYGPKSICQRRRILTSRFAEQMVKIPRALVSMAKSLNHTKRRQFSYQGAMDFAHPSKMEGRRWVMHFAKANFADDDHLRLTDAGSRRAYYPLGKFDVSLNAKEPTQQPPVNNTGPFDIKFDSDYFGTMATSKFTLCPAGDPASDHGWSERAWEAAMMRSICVIRSLDQDVNGNDLLCRIPFKYYTVNSNMTYRKDVADWNYNTFIKYQTFIKGDNEPPHGCQGMVVE